MGIAFSGRTGYRVAEIRNPEDTSEPQDRYSLFLWTDAPDEAKSYWSEAHDLPWHEAFECAAIYLKRRPV